MDIFAIAIALSTGVFSSLLTWLLGRRAAARAVKVTEFDVITREWGELYDNLQQRMEDLESSLVVEREEHQRTRRLLAGAVSHIRDVVTWAAGNRGDPIPAPPRELLELSHIRDVVTWAAGARGEPIPVTPHELAEQT